MVSGINMMTKQVNVTVDIDVARVMLGIAGFDIKGKSDDEVFEQVLEMMTDYGGTGEVVENISLTEKEFDTYDELDPELG